jgi:gluconate 2-dehydrogenase gamma chain
MTFISRRDLLKRAAAVGAVAVAPPSGSPFAGGHVEGDPERVAPHGALPREPLENLTASEADLLDAIVARLIPTDANGPGATEARAAHYIDRALGGALASSRPAYTAGLAALDRYARSSRGKAFLELSPLDQDSVLIDVETGAATGFTGSSALFFAMVLSHTHQGTFGDPYYGGNANFIGWDLLGYPGIRTMVTAADQRQLEKNELKPNHKSAYDYPTFTKATARVNDEGLPRRSSPGGAADTEGLPRRSSPGGGADTAGLPRRSSLGAGAKAGA